MAAFPQRKHVRLKNYDYSQDGAYFVTICTKERKPLLSTIPVGRGALTTPRLRRLPCVNPVGRGALTPPPASRRWHMLSRLIHRTSVPTGSRGRGSLFLSNRNASIYPKSAP